ncbi:MAG: 1-(5-phosphoribosyl)-5-[(5-phosphoribosylamino)methylideneamino]imidazole-4-carboxamide isomerase [Bacteroidales bacterium]|jgi:phosphoribosylformimino-5-aminoimidazole carboxamide ribotide isomerase|nr:1-(5-phosphoribosyl)-5-[(5-phosphoribosylamino)methylideneamino]imidazole-4-carboxamide isomerase [Bacteroidales bacterium]
MIEIIPAIDIIGGKCVRLSQGDYDKCKVYSEKPVDVAKEFADNGIKKLHLIDLDGAKSNEPQNLDLLNAIVTETGMKVEFGGGLKSKWSIRRAFDNGAEKAICGSIAFTEPTVFSYWLDCFGPDVLTLGADMKDGKIAVKGWSSYVERNFDEFIKIFLQDGLKNVIITDIDRDGMLEGPSIELYEGISAKFPRLNITASGGVGSMEDIMALDKAGLHSVIVGKAIYEEKIKLSDIVDYYKDAR